MAEDEIIKKHTSAVYKTWIDPKKNWLHKLKDIRQKIVIIVFAVRVNLFFIRQDCLQNGKSIIQRSIVA